MQSKVHASIRDYTHIVPPDEQCWIGQMKEKAEHLQYNSWRELQQDSEKMFTAAKKYNSPSGGKSRNPGIS